MIELSCPSCGASVKFHSKASVFAVCSFCKSTLIRHDMNLEMIGKMAELQDDLTPLQLGTTGIFDGKKFDIIGRLKVGYSDGFWNEWYTLSAGDREGWLAEAQGFYAMCFSVPDKGIPPEGALVPGQTVMFKSEGMFEVEDKRPVKCLFAEGELPMNAAQGRASISVDLSGPDRKMATIEYALGHPYGSAQSREVRVFVGKYQDFDLFKFKNLRRIDGW